MWAGRPPSLRRGWWLDVCLEANFRVMDVSAGRREHGLRRPRRRHARGAWDRLLFPGFFKGVGHGFVG